MAAAQWACSIRPTMAYIRWGRAASENTLAAAARGCPERTPRSLHGAFPFIPRSPRWRAGIGAQGRRAAAAGGLR
jgi:hypothetical protein